MYLPDAGFFSQVGPVLSHFAGSLTPGALIISAISLGIMIFWDKTPLKNFKLLPPALVVVLLGVGLNLLYEFVIPALHLDEVHLVNIPEINRLSELVTYPDFSSITNPQV